VQAHNASGSSSTFLRYSSTDFFQSSIHGSSLNIPAYCIQGSEDAPTSRPTISVPLLRRPSIFARSFASASSRVAPRALTANGSLLRARKPSRGDRLDQDSDLHDRVSRRVAGSDGIRSPRGATQIRRASLPFFRCELVFGAQGLVIS
jgi:hypothetical protein